MKLAAFLLSLTIICTGTVNAQTDTACGTIHVAYYELGALYYKNTEGSYAGIDKDVIEEVARRSGCHFETRLESRVRIWTQLKENSLDMSVSGIPTPEREQFAEFVPYFATRNYVLLHIDVPVQAYNMDGFLADPNLKVGVVRSFHHGAQTDEWIDKLRAQKRVYEAADFDTLMHLLMIRRIDAIFALPIVWAPLLKNDLVARQVIILDWLPHDTIVHGLIVSKMRISKARLELMRKAISSMADDGSLEQIFTRHIGAKLAREIRYDGPR